MQGGLGLVLADALAGDVTGVGEPGPQDDHLVDALVQSLDLDPESAAFLNV